MRCLWSKLVRRIAKPIGRCLPHWFWDLFWRAAFPLYLLFQSFQQAQLNAAVANLTLSLENFLDVHFEVSDLILQQAATVVSQRKSDQKNSSAKAFSEKLGELQGILPAYTSGVRGSNELGEVVLWREFATRQTIECVQAKVL